MAEIYLFMNRLTGIRKLGWIFLVIFVAILLWDFSKQGVYDEDLGINLVVVGDDQVGILVLRPKEELYSWIVLPDEIKIKVFNLTAEYPLKSLWKFGVGEKNPYEVVEKSLGMEMGLFLSRVVKIDGSLDLVKLPTALVGVKTKTDLSFKDRWLLRSSINEILGSKRVMEQSFPTSAFDVIVEPDGVSYKKFNKIASVWIKDKFYVDAVFHLGLGVAINNMSDTVGLASLTATQMDSAGFRVISVGNEVNEKVSGNGCFYTISEKNSLIQKYLETQANCQEIEVYEPLATESSLVKLKVWIK